MVFFFALWVCFSLAFSFVCITLCFSLYVACVSIRRVARQALVGGFRCLLHNSFFSDCKVVFFFCKHYDLSVFFYVESKTNTLTCSFTNIRCYDNFSSLRVETFIAEKYVWTILASLLNGHRETGIIILFYHSLPKCILS